MAEISAIASIVGVAGAGAKLSLLLYEFASTVASARNDVISVGRDISLSSAVLKQVASVFDNRKAARFSTTALGTTLDIVERCQGIFQEIDSIVQSLIKDRADGTKSSVSFIAKVKWTFKRSKVQLLQGTLDSMKITLQLMLTTLDLSERIYSQCNSSVNTLPVTDGSVEEEQVQAVAQSLVIAHQLSIEKLQELEEEDFKQNSECESNVSGGPKTQEVQSPNSQYIEFETPCVQSTEVPSVARRVSPGTASEWLSDVASDHVVSRPGSIASNLSDVRQQTLALAGKWTTDVRRAIVSQNVESLPSRKGFMRNTITLRKKNPPVESSSTQKVDTGHRKNKQDNGGDDSSSKRLSPTRSGFPHAFERWEDLSSHWEGLTAYWNKHLEDNSKEIDALPYTMQLSRQVTDLSLAGANQFQAMVELQRLHDRSERKFQSWFVETRAEQERSQELQKVLELELRMTKIESRKIWSNSRDLETMAEAKKRKQETQILDLRCEVANLLKHTRMISAQLGEERHMKDEAIANAAAARESERMISEKRSRLINEFARLRECVEEF